MNEEKAIVIVQMISASGAAKSKYIEAISEARESNFEEAQKLIKEGSECFSEAHRVHADLLSTEANGVNSEVSLLIVHAEDQMMSAEMFRTIAEELIMLYEKFNSVLIKE